MERWFTPFSEDQIPPNLPSYLDLNPGLSDGFAYGMNPYHDGLQFPAPYQPPPAAVLDGGPTTSPEAQFRKSANDFCEEPPRRRRDRYQYNYRQQAILGAMYEKTKFPDYFQRAELIQQVGVDEIRIQLWFKNRRARESKEVKKQHKLLRRQSRYPPEPKPKPEPKPSVVIPEMKPPAMPVTMELPPKPSSDVSELNSAVQSIMNEFPEPSCVDAGGEETDTTYTELSTAPPAPDQSVPFDPFLYQFFTADASSHTVQNTFPTQP